MARDGLLGTGQTFPLTKLLPSAFHCDVINMDGVWKVNLFDRSCPPQRPVITIHSPKPEPAGKIPPKHIS